MISSLWVREGAVFLVELFDVDIWGGAEVRTAPPLSESTY